MTNVCSLLSMINMEILAPNWIFYYFQVLGLHSINEKRSFCFLYYQICFSILLLVNYVWIHYYVFTLVGGLNTIVGVCIMERNKFNDVFKTSSNNLFVEAMFTLAFGSSLYCNIICHNDKLKIFQAFIAFDDFITINQKRRLDFKTLNSNCGKAFGFIWFLSMLACTMMLGSIRNFSPQSIFYYIQYISLSHVIHLQTFQISIFVRGVQVRLNIILKRLKLLSINSNSRKLFECKQSFLLLHNVNSLMSKCFRLPLLLNFLQLYFSLLSNFYWLGMALIGRHSATVSSKYLKMMP